jgi:uncharacterized protein YegL
VTLAADNQPIVGAGYDAATWNTAHPLAFPKAGVACEGTWPISLATEQPVIGKFINLTDIKPGDQGENTVSMHVYTNDVWACVGMANLHNDDNGLTSPEFLAGDTTDGVGNGELAENMYFYAWKDDGDNVYEAGEQALTPNPVPGSAITAGTWALADATTGGVPLAGDVTQYVGLAWCAGEMIVDGNTISCSNETMGNEAQTDSFMADMKLSVVQARNNANFVCVKEEEPTPTPTPTEEPTETPTPTPTPGHIVVDKVTSPALDLQSFDFQTTGNGYVGFSLTDEATANDQTLDAGTYAVSENPVANWAQTSADCVSSIGDTETIASLELDEGETITCTFTNTYTAPCIDQGDVMLVLDRSGSISSSEMTQLKNAALAFVTTLAPDGGVHMGQTSFQTTGALNTQLTGLIATINAGINALTTSSGYTNLFDGISLASAELASVRERVSAPNLMIIITDGNPNRPTPTSNAIAQALTAATTAKGLGTTIYVVGVGSDVNATYLQTIASPGLYYGIGDYSGLQAALTAIATCQ